MTDEFLSPPPKPTAFIRNTDIQSRHVCPAGCRKDCRKERCSVYLKSVADMYRSDGYLRIAEKLYSQVTAEDPAYEDAWFSLGQTEETLGCYEDALSSYGQAAEIDPSFGRALYARARVLQILGRYSTALAEYDNLLGLYDMSFLSARRSECLAKLLPPDEPLSPADLSREDLLFSLIELGKSAGLLSEEADTDYSIDLIAGVKDLARYAAMRFADLSDAGAAGKLWRLCFYLGLTTAAALHSGDDDAAALYLLRTAPPALDVDEMIPVLSEYIAMSPALTKSLSAHADCCISFVSSQTIRDLFDVLQRSEVLVSYATALGLSCLSSDSE